MRTDVTRCNEGGEGGGRVGVEVGIGRSFLRRTRRSFGDRSEELRGRLRILDGRLWPVTGITNETNGLGYLSEFQRI